MSQLKLTAYRYHDISCGHRVVGHEGKCCLLHGHNYRVHFHCVAENQDALGRVIDFSVIKYRLCEWLEEHWDHKMLLWVHDPMLPLLRGISRTSKDIGVVLDGIVQVPFNPVAENIAKHLLCVVGPKQLEGTGARLLKVVIDETRKCGVEAQED